MRHVTKSGILPDDQEVPSQDCSWIIVAVDRYGDGWIMDAAQGFYDTDVFIGSIADDNGIAVPPGTGVGIYRMTDVDLDWREDEDSREVLGPLIDGKWETIHVV